MDNLKNPITKNCGDGICYHCNEPLYVIESISNFIKLNKNGTPVNIKEEYHNITGCCPKCGTIFKNIKRFGMDYVHAPILLKKSSKSIINNPFLKGDGIR